MARRCENCGRGSLKSAFRSHSNIKTIRRQRVNIQKTLIGGKSALLCTSCMRTQSRKLATAT